MLFAKNILSHTLKTFSALTLLGTIFTSVGWAMDNIQETKRIIIKDKKSYLAALAPEAEADQIVITGEFLASCRFANMEGEFLMRDVCTNLVKKHPNIISLQLLSSKCLEQDVNEPFPVAIPKILGFENIGVDTNPLCALLQYSFPRLRSLTIYHGKIESEEMFKNILTQIPSLTHLFVLSDKDGTGTKDYIGTKEKFSKGWEIMSASPTLKTLQWHKAPISNEAARSIYNVVKTTTTLQGLDLTGAHISNTGRAKIKEAASTNPNITVKIEKE